MEALFTAWRSWTAHAREAALIVRNQELVNLIDGHMRVLWQAEIQARQLGVKGAIDPFDPVQLPLLSTMQFDHTGVRVVKWPKEACEDPERVVNALLKAQTWSRAASRSLLHTPESAPRRLHDKSWPRLFENTPTSWSALEYALAQLIEQLLLVAVDAQTKKQKQIASAKKQPRSAQAPQVSDSKPLVSALGNEEEDEEADDAEDQLGQGTARAAKRQRQRERRKMFRAEARTAAAAVASEGGASVVDSNRNAVFAEAQQGALGTGPMEKSEMSDKEDDLAPRADEMGDNRRNANEEVSAHVAPSAEDEPIAPEGSERAEHQVLQALRAQVEQLERSLAEGRTGEHAKAARALAQDKTSKLQATKKEQAKSLQKPSISKANDKIELRSTEEDKEGGSQPHSQLGVGRGTPLFVQSTPLDMFAGPGGGRSGGRGRAMPGPCTMQQRRFQAPPGGLSQPWMAAPAIPEEDDEEADTSSAGLSANLKQMNPAWVHRAGLINGSLSPGYSYPSSGSVSPMLMSNYMSAAQTPQRVWPGTPEWPGTPSPPGTPCEPCAPAGRDVLPASALPPASMSGFGMGFPGSATGGMPPTYVWVPLAMAHACPHCGCTFAFPPGGAGDHEDASSTDAGSEKSA